jgi:hypothetical protein
VKHSDFGAKFDFGREKKFENFEAPNLKKFRPGIRILAGSFEQGAKIVFWREI